jgi:hypothetical protein
VPLSKFGERHYELAANLELIAGSGRFFAPPTNLEATLGIDVALAPGDPKIWDIIGVQPPPGVHPSRTAGWQAATSPPFLLSLFVQYKRSTSLKTRRATEWRAHREPYWRVELTKHQHAILLELEASSGRQAVVRYAAPRFWSYEDMWRHQATGAVLDNSLIVAPCDIGRAHARLTWSPNIGLVGHSEPEPVRLESSSDLAEAVRLHVRQRPSGDRRGRAYLDALAGALEEVVQPVRGREEWANDLVLAADLSDRPGLEPETASALADLVIIQQAAQRARASWLLVSLPEAPMTEPAGDP